MYNFIDTNEQPDNVGGVQVIYNSRGFDIDGIVEFRVLSISGRGVITPDVSVTNKVGSAGVWVDDVSLPSRTIRVEMLMETDDYRESFDHLNTMANSGAETAKELRFTDDSGYYYMAYLVGVTVPREVSNRSVVTFEFLCPDPYKYSSSEVVFTNLRVPSSIVYPTLPNRMRFVASGSAERVRIYPAFGSGGIIIDQAVVSGDVVILSWSGENWLTINGVPSMHKLSILSTYENMYMQRGYEYATSPNGSLEIRIDERRL